MGTLPIEKLHIGLELAADVASPQGMKIAASGDAITAKHIKAFKAWGVTEVNVKGAQAHQAPNKAEAQTVDVSKDELIQELDGIFKRTDRSNPVIAKIYDLALRKALSKDDFTLD